MLESLIRQLLFQLNPETAHRIAQQLIRLRYSHFVSQKTLGKPIQLFGLTFPNPVGLAAGWDKNADCFDALFRMGFGFVEVGTVTPKPQEGNPKPRLFRLKKKRALINRMGFNNAGIDAMVSNLQKRKASGILGVNIGKNKDTPLNQALDDYEICLKAVYPYADYVVVNISSPNTPGLRELQSVGYLNDLLRGLQNVKKNKVATFQKELPLLVKTTVDLPIENYERFVRTLMDNDIDGVIISNTTINHHEKEQGGLSGSPLRAPTSAMIRAIAEISERKLPIIGVGGIFSHEDARAHTEAGAQLVQIMTGFVYRGGELIKEIVN